MISVIIPVYNAEPYLSRCLDSVLASIYCDFELILVNDGSTDGSLRICTEYAERDSRVKLLSQKNQGVSAARNLGLEQCGGEWVVFIDADDLISKDFFELIAREDPQQTDMLLFDFTYNEAKLASGNPQARKHCFGDKAILQFQRDIVNPQEGHTATQVRPLWAKAYKRSIIEQASLRFDTGLYYSEDTLFQLEYRLNVKSCVYIPHTVYYYNVHEDSAAHRFNPKMLDNHVRLLEKVRLVLEAHRMFPAMECDYYCYVLDEISTLLFQLAFDPRNTGMSYREKCKLCGQIKQYEFCKQAAKYNFKCGTLRRRILLSSFYLRWYRLTEAICKVIHIRRRRRKRG